VSQRDHRADATFTFAAFAAGKRNIAVVTPFLRSLLVAALLATTWGCHRSPLQPQLPPDASLAEDATRDLPAPPDARDANDAPSHADGPPPADGPSPPDGPPDAPPNPPPACPTGTAAPLANIICTRGAPCGCRDDPRAECESVATCTPSPPGGSGAYFWVIATPACAPLPPSPCPATALEARDQPCTPHLADCVYPGNLHCYCLTSGEINWSSSGTCGAPSLRWYCGFDDGPGPCPDGVPEVGAACAPEGQVCGTSLQPCFNQYGRECKAAIWQLEGRTTECI
jgi:hypothetical protein